MLKMDVVFMKKTITIGIILIFSIAIGVLFFIESKQNNYIDIKNDNLLWNLYDINIKKIEDNMNFIAEGNDTFKWYKIKEINNNDDEYNKILNEIFINIRICYMSLEDDNELFTNSNYAKKYRTSDKISKDELNFLKTNRMENRCIDKFKAYKDIEINTKEENKERLLNKINYVLDFSEKYFIKESNSYNEFIYNEIVETEILKELSNFLVEESSI